MPVATAVRKLIPDRFKQAWWYCTDSAWRGRYRSIKRRQRALHKLQLQAFRSLHAQTGGRIAAGPFQGLVYLNDRSGTYPQKLLGTYEKELWGVVESIVTRGYERIIDIGAAEGYYVCGLAARIPQSQVVAFEAQAKCHPRIRELARRNGVDGRVECRGLCRAEDLRDALSKNAPSLVICDIEGAEFDLLMPVEIPSLRGADLLVEVHEDLRPGVGDEMIRRFQATHDLELICSQPRTLADIPAGIELSDELARAAMEESRGGEMVWHWMRKR